MPKPLILVTNDDGIHARGLEALVEAAIPHGEVVVVAPDKGQSGKSHSITFAEPLFSRKVNYANGVEAYSCSGTPVDCVKLALNQLLGGRRPDLILSGINHGSNSSINVIYSGTMAAAIEGTISGISSAGFSLVDFNIHADLSLARKHSGLVIQKMLEHRSGEALCLNVNIPAVNAVKTKGIRVCRQADARWHEEFDKRTHKHGFDYYWLTGVFHNSEPSAKDTDEWLLKQGYTTVVPITIDFTNHNALEKLAQLF